MLDLNLFFLYLPRVGIAGTGSHDCLLLQQTHFSVCGCVVAFLLAVTKHRQEAAEERVAFSWFTVWATVCHGGESTVVGQGLHHGRKTTGYIPCSSGVGKGSAHPTDSLPPVWFHLLKAPQCPQMVPPAGAHESMGTFHIQIIMISRHTRGHEIKQGSNVLL